jgi:hypothetical protein
LTLKLGHFLNKTILVSIPALFEDGACRSYTLRGVDLPGGLWLQSDDLSRRLLADDQQVLVSASPVVFRSLRTDCRRADSDDPAGGFCVRQRTTPAGSSRHARQGQGRLRVANSRRGLNQDEKKQMTEVNVVRS